MTTGVDSAISRIKTELNSGRYVFDNKNIKHLVKNELDLMLSSGQITKQDAKEVKKFFDYNMREALCAKNQSQYLQNRVGADYDFERLKYSQKSELTGNGRRLNKIVKDTGLTFQDLVEVAKLAGDDYAVNKVKLSKAEKEAGKRGERTRSELANIQNALNAKIKENGYTKELSKNDVITLMKEIGITDGTKNRSFTAYLRQLAMTVTIVPMLLDIPINGHDAVAFEHYTHGSQNEKAYGEQSVSTDGSVTNEVEAKMHKFDVVY